MTREQAENFIEMIMIVVLIFVTVLVANGVIQSICIVTINGLTLLWGIISYRFLDWLDKR